MDGDRIMAAGGGVEEDELREPDAAINRSCDQGQGTESTVDVAGPHIDVPATAVAFDDGATQGASCSSCSNAIHVEGRVTPKTAQQLGIYYYYKRRRFFKGKIARSPGQIAFSSSKSNKTASNRGDLSCQLEERAHRLLKDAGWSTTPRIRNDRPKMAFYFAAPQREVVVTSLAQAWELCGQMLHTASGGSEWGKFPREWSDINQFWKDLVTTMDYVGKVTVDGENSHTLLRQWQFLDPFVAVLFIDKRITALQKQKTVVAVDSSTHVVDGAYNRASGRVSCSGHQNGKCYHHLSTSSQETCVDPELCFMQNMDFEVASRTENHFQSNSEPTKINSGENLGTNLVKRVRKKSKWLSDFESTGLNGLYARSFTQPTICLNDSGSCLSGSSKSKKCVKAKSGSEKLREESKKHVKAKAGSEKLREEKGDLSLHLAHQRVNVTRGEGRTEGIAGRSEAKCAVTDAGKTVTAKRQHSRTPKKSSVRGSSKGLTAVSNSSNIVAELRHKRNSNMAECSTSPEAKSKERTATKMESEIWEKHARKRPSEIDFNDDDLLITVIVKNRDRGSSCHESASWSVSSKAKLRMLKSPKQGSRLLIQTTQKGDKDVLDGKRMILARKTVLCWLIATGVMTLKDVVQCRNPKNNKVLKDGWVTWDGILCSCCIKTLSMSDFKAHADSSLPKSSLNLSLQSGKSLTLCQLEAWTAEYMYRQSNDCTRKVETEATDENDDTCGICGDGGELLCCDNCPSTYHQACLSAKELPDDSWYCHNCTCQSCGCPVSDKISSFSAILKCLQCGAAYHDTCVEMGAKTFEDIVSDEWFCGRYCKEMYLGLHGCVGVEHSLGDGLSWTLLRCNSGGQQLCSIQKIARVVECNTKLAVALNLIEECFVQMVDTRTGIDMIPHVLYNQGSKYARLDYQGFYTMVLEKSEEILCAASIRVHGTKAAELPFIATCREHRRQGMCRRLLNTIEEMLRSFHVKVLVLSAIPELVSTWVSAFGFKPVEEDERKQLDTMNLMLFPGTSLLIKNLEDCCGTNNQSAIEEL